MTEERKAAVTLKGNPITLFGPELKVGEKAPDFTCDQGLGPTISLSDMGDKVKVFNVLLSIATPVCQTQTRKFNEELGNIDSELEAYIVRVDLPMSHKTFCGTEGIEAIKGLSDYKNNSFGSAYGVLMSEHKVLCRAVFVIDKDNIIQHVEYVSEIAEEPDYDAALNVIKSLL